jgi:type I restriction-modification system DNA methylase subunit
MSDWGGERLREDVRWKYGLPPVGNANFAWVQHFIHHASPPHPTRIGFVSPQQPNNCD